MTTPKVDGIELRATTDIQIGELHICKDIPCIVCSERFLQEDIQKAISKKLLTFRKLR